MSRRSILKHPSFLDVHNTLFPEPFPFAACPTVQLSPHVHFPPTPTLTSTFVTHSPSTYDRTPAEVLPNNCALPGRHEREFVETPSYSHRSSALWQPEGLKGSYFHPRAFEASSIEPSESDDSDTIRTPPEPAYIPTISIEYTSINTSHPMMPYSLSQADIDSALSFLPSSPSRDKKGVHRSHSYQGRNHQSKKSREASADGRIRHESEFKVPSLDFEGCLGGF